MVLHRHVGKGDQSSFLLQEQFFFFLFATALSSRSSTALRLAFQLCQAWLIACLALPCRAMGLPRAKHARSSVTSHPFVRTCALVL